MKSGSIHPTEEIQITHAYPNPIYYVAGTRKTKIGWAKEIPDGIREFYLWFFWTVVIDNNPEKRLVVQNIHVKLKDDGPGMYSMCSMTWEDSPVAPVKSQLCCVAQLEEIGEYRMAAPGFRHELLHDSRGQEIGMILHEEVFINAARLDEPLPANYLFTLRV